MAAMTLYDNVSPKIISQTLRRKISHIYIIKNLGYVW